MKRENSLTNLHDLRGVPAEGETNMSGYLRRGGAWSPGPDQPPTGYLRVKARLEQAAALGMLALSLPLLLVTAVLVRLTSRGPAIYAQKRVGANGRPFTIYKLRTMSHDAERETGPQWSPPGDPRITPVGRVLRILHLDELPQLWNVLRGEMNLIGPRPERPEIIRMLRRRLPDYELRLAMPPGITGLAQVQLASDTEVDDVRRKLALDLSYIERFGPWLDFRILVATGLKLFGVPRGAIRLLFFGPESARNLPPGGAAPAHIESARVA